APEAYLRSGQYQLVNWQLSAHAAFEQAQRRNRLVLVEVGAYWSGRCQRLGREAFSDSGVADLVNREFVALKVDAESMPKLARYARQLAVLQGYPVRYPILLWFTPEGKPVRAVAPDTRAEIMRHLEELSHLFRNRPEQIAQLTAQLEQAWNTRWARTARFAMPDANAVEAFLKAVESLPEDNYDLNMLETLLLIAERGDGRAQQVLRARLQSLSVSPLWCAQTQAVHALEEGVDPEGKPIGGKRLIDQARLLSLYSRAARFEPELSTIAHALADTLRTRYFRERPAGFLGTLASPKLQSALAQLPGMPQRDPALYTDANAYAVIALVDYAETFGAIDPQAYWARQVAPRVLQTLAAMRTRYGDLFHSSLRATRDWLPDMALTIRAAVRVYRLTREQHALQLARSLLEYIWQEHADPTGGFYDVARSEQWGVLKVAPVRMSSDDTLPADNALLALAMWEYARASGDTKWRERAQQLIQVMAGDYDPNQPLAHTGYIQLLVQTASP
ncbi:MAG: DUF255 domain-containing protein, partial [Armatimonadota bacterium]|nr:DUF255 domain-containing protein [Armatimonadota bacterium]